MDKKEAIDLLGKHGYKTTERRTAILSYFEEMDGYCSAKELFEYMEAMYEGISFDTVYRNLHLYNELKILETTILYGEKHFRMNCAKHHHHHFICKACGKTKKINMCPMDEIDHSLKNYYVEDHKFEVYGLCPLCKSA